MGPRWCRPASCWRGAPKPRRSTSPVASPSPYSRWSRSCPSTPSTCTTRTCPGTIPDYTQYAAADMTGSNRLLMGLGWPVVVLVGILVARKTGATKSTGLVLEVANRVELGFLLIAGVVAFVIPATGQIHLVFGLALLAWFAFYLLQGQPRRRGRTGPDRYRRRTRGVTRPQPARRRGSAWSSCPARSSCSAPSPLPTTW